METAQVDVRKLQMLNDRINQTIDALNQVRLSVHGMSHTGIPSVVSPFAPTGYPVNNTNQTQFGGFPQSIGFGHTAGFPVNPQAYGVQNPLQNGILQNAITNPFLAQLWGATQYGVTQNPFGTGFAHTGAETLDPSFLRRGLGNNSIDPFATTRLAQTFPFAQWGYSPFASGSSPFASGMY